MSTPAPSIPEALRALFAAVVAAGRSRLELFGIELAEQKSNAIKMGIGAAAGLLCLAMAAAVFTALIAAAFWYTEYRLLAIALVGLAWLIAGLLCLYVVARAARKAQHPFALTLAELERDVEVLSSPLAEPTAPTRRPTRPVRGGASGAYNPVDPGDPQ